ncbi:hypothetical protein AALO_G00175910 [Alosa alosa]|uniref:Uncharacterized protein n=1 Tax=Alosa alosa TaxID=278164 RepID=A0AAV6G7J4_9TELE|nr:hypothetical protein AALO_G00175910 [Alosa alosa]
MERFSTTVRAHGQNNRRLCGPECQSPSRSVKRQELQPDFTGEKENPRHERRLGPRSGPCSRHLRSLSPLF